LDFVFYYDNKDMYFIVCEYLSVLPICTQHRFAVIVTSASYDGLPSFEMLIETYT